jgi:hypothetical protein
MVADLHVHSVSLVERKYRHPRLAYLWFLGAFAAGVLGVVAVVAQQLLGRQR